MSRVRDRVAPAVLAAAVLAACLGQPPEGRFACDRARPDVSRCPSGWICRADRRCWRDDVPMDAGVDAPLGDADLDAGRADARDSDVDAARDGGGPPPCRSSVDTRNEDLQRGDLEGFCVEGEGTASPRSHVVVSVDPRDAGDFVAVVDLRAEPGATRVRLFDERELDEGDYAHLVLQAATATSGDVLLSIEAIGRDGRALGAIAACAAPSCDCDGAPLCLPVEPDGVTSFAVGELLARHDIDPRDVVATRRVVEVRGGASVTVDGFRRFASSCPGWWRDAPVDYALLETLDALTPLSPGLQVPAGERMTIFPGLSVCGAALGFDGSRSIEWRPAGGMSLAEPITIELFWHPEIGTSPIRAGTILESIDGLVSVGVASASRLYARAGDCAGSPALEVTAMRSLAAPDNQWAELEVLVDWPGAVLCLADSGRLLGCDSTPACALGAPPSSPGLRLGRGATPGSGIVGGGIDEVRVLRGDHFPGRRGAATGACYVDRVCARTATPGLRDAGSNACVDRSACTTISACPSHAAGLGPCDRDPSAAPCDADPACYGGARRCGGDCTSLAFCLDALECP